ARKSQRPHLASPSRGVATPAFRTREPRMNAIDWRPVVRGIATMVPGAYRLAARKRGGGTGSADYCYAVWLKHLTLLWQSGLRTIPASVAEIGPGDALGGGLAALLSGASRFYALDVVTYGNADKNLRVLDELVE